MRFFRGLSAAFVFFPFLEACPIFYSTRPAECCRLHLVPQCVGDGRNLDGFGKALKLASKSANTLGPLGPLRSP